jgi:hypothetical protein
MKSLVIAFITVFASLSFAKQYADAGCGLGLQLMGKDGNQILAATTNGTSGNQTFGISSGTSGCTDGGTMAENKQVPAFIEMNKEALAIESARGQGETLAGLAQLMGCQVEKFAPAMKKNYNKIFIETNMQPAAIEAGARSVCL